ncbi:MAG: 4Fe-4S dicluster domain-containing protein [Candidatus Brockarchaeota archaeon]|nr:4Fe-4S dicluster domain-containing protein [Candidatus Brockarchaeota archaeon]
MAGEDRVWIRRNYEKCSGCRRCEIACSLHHEGRIWPEASRIRVLMLIPGVEIPHLCFQCENYPCVKACPAGALSVNSGTGAVEVDSSKCTGCGLCVDACPGRVPHLHPGRNNIVICNLCKGDPACVKECVKGKWGALELVPAGSVASRRALAKTPMELTRETALKIMGEEVLKEALG